MDTYSINGLTGSAGLWNRHYSPVSGAAVLVGGKAGGTVDAIPSADAARAILVAAFASIGESFRTLSNQPSPVYATSYVSTQPQLATLTGISARLYPVIDNQSVLQTAQAINTRTTTVRSSTSDLGLDLSAAAASRLYSAAGLGIDLSSPQAASSLRSAETLGLDTSSPDAASRLYSAQSLALDVSSAQAASILKSSSGLALDVDSAQRASSITSTAEARPATTSYGSNTLSFSGSGAPSTSSASLSGVYTGVNSAESATSLTLKLQQNVAAMNGVTGSATKFDVLNNSGTTIFSFDGVLKAGQQVYLGDDIGLSVSFSAGSLTSNHSAATTVSKTNADVDPNATFNNPNSSLRPQFENNAQVSAGSFTVNGTSVSVLANDTVNSVLARINATVSGISASFANDKVTLASTGFSEDNIVLAGDSSGFLSALKLSGAATDRGNVRDDQQTLAKTSQFAAVASGSFSVNGVAIAVNRHTDSLGTIIGKINGSAAGVTASFDAAQNKLVLSTNGNSEDDITVADDSSGFVAAAKLSTSIRGNVRDDLQVLAKTTQFAAVTSGSFTINGVAIALDRNTDSLATLATRINNSGAGVTAAYDATNDKFVLTGTSNGMDQIDVGADSTGFLAAAHLQTGNTQRGHLSQDTVALSNLAQFSAVSNGSFVIDGKTIAVDTATDSVQSLIGKINASGARIVANYDKLSDRITLQTTDDSEDEIPVGSDTSGFLAAARLDAADTQRGNVRDDLQKLAKTTQFGTVVNGSFEINGMAFGVDTENDSMATIIDRINSGDAGVFARFDAATNRIELVSTTAGEDLIDVGNDSSGFLSSAKLASGNTIRGNLPDDQQVFAKTWQFAGVANGAFSINGVTISVDADNDTLQSVISRINGAGAGVSAGYDSASGKLVFTPDEAGAALALEDDSSGFLSAAGIAIGAFHTRFNPDAAFDADGLDAPFFDNGQSVSAGSFRVNGVDISVANDDTLNAVLARITASAAGVVATYDSDTGTVKLSRNDGKSSAITVADDSSGFLAAVKLDASAISRTGSEAAKSFDVTLDKMSEYAKVNSGTLTLNGQAISIDKNSTTIRGLVSAINGIDGIQASLEESSGRIKILAKRPGDAINLSDSSGVLAALGLAGGTYHGSPGSTRAVQTLVGSTMESNAGDVVNQIAQAVTSANAALPDLGRLRDGGQMRTQVEAMLRNTFSELGEAGLNGLSIGKNTRGFDLLLDHTELASSLARLSGGTEGPGVGAGERLAKLSQQIAALGTPPAATATNAARQPVDREQVREQLKAVFKPDPVSKAWVLDLVHSARPPPATPRTAKTLADAYESALIGAKKKIDNDRFDTMAAPVAKSASAVKQARRYEPAPMPEFGPARWPNSQPASSVKWGVA